MTSSETSNSSLPISPPSHDGATAGGFTLGGGIVPRPTRPEIGRRPRSSLRPDRQGQRSTTTGLKLFTPGERVPAAAEAARPTSAHAAERAVVPALTPAHAEKR